MTTSSPSVNTNSITGTSIAGAVVGCVLGVLIGIIALVVILRLTCKAKSSGGVSTDGVAVFTNAAYGFGLRDISDNAAYGVIIDGVTVSNNTAHEVNKDVSTSAAYEVIDDGAVSFSVDYEVIPDEMDSRGHENEYY
jgi:hypothetical protein